MDPHIFRARNTDWGTLFKVEGQFTLPLFEGGERNPQFIKYLEWLKKQRLRWEVVHITQRNIEQSLINAPGFRYPHIDSFIVLAIQRERQNG